MNEPRLDQAAGELPIACTLEGADRRQRGEEIEQLLLEGSRAVRPLADGVALQFPGDEIWAARLLAFIVGERACCPFFTFELLFEPDHGPIWLHLRGPEGATDFVADLLTRVEVQEHARQ